MEELEALLADLGSLELLDEVHALAEAAVDVCLVATDLAHAEQRALPEVVVLALGDRHVELVLHPRLDRAEHAPLALERVVVVQQQLEPEDADDHCRPPAQAERSAACAPFVAAGARRRATSSTSYASITSPTLTSWYPSSDMPHS